MVTSRQRTVLIGAAILGAVAFCLQPMVDSDGRRLGWYPPTLREVEVAPDRREFAIPYADYRMLAAEYVALTFVAACLYLASGRREP